jgi:hypothetical protein
MKESNVKILKRGELPCSGISSIAFDRSVTNLQLTSCLGVKWVLQCGHSDFLSINHLLIHSLHQSLDQCGHNIASFHILLKQIRHWKISLMFFLIVELLMDLPLPSSANLSPLVSSCNLSIANKFCKLSADIYYSC